MKAEKALTTPQLIQEIAKLIGYQGNPKISLKVWNKDIQSYEDSTLEIVGVSCALYNSEDIHLYVQNKSE